MAFLHILVQVALLLPVAIVSVDLEFRCDQGNYLIKNPDTTRYTGVSGRYENGTVCDSNTGGADAEILIVSACGMERIQVDLLEGESVGDTGMISCSDGERRQSGYILPIVFIFKSHSIIKSGVAHYSCHESGIVLVKNPRVELYINSVAYSLDQHACVTKHNLDNKVIEIYDCNTDSGVVLMTSERSASDMHFILNRKSDVFLLHCSDPSPIPNIDSLRAGNGDMFLEYDCYEDGTVVANNPRTELFRFSYAEQNSQVLPTLFVKSYNQVIISNCDFSDRLFLVLSRDPIDNAFVIRPNNVFIIECNL